MEDLILTNLHESRVIADECLELQKVGICCAGFTRVFGNHTRRSTSNDLSCTHVQITVSGEAEVLENGRWVKAPANTAYVMPSGSKWAWRYNNSNSQQPWNVIYVRLLPEFNLHLLENKSDPFILQDRIPTDLLWTFHRLYREILFKKRPTILLLLSQMFAYHTRECLNEEIKISCLPDLWGKVIANLAQQWNLQQLSKVSKMSVEKLRLLCKKETGRSPMAQVTFLRLRRACELIAQGIYNMQEIGIRVGYNNPFSFSRAFKNFYGESPLSYAKKIQQRK